MQYYTSLKGNKISIPPETKNKEITDILQDRIKDEAFILNPTFEDLHDPFLLKDMDKAVERIIQAKESEEKVMIFGDYDVDGVTSTSLLMHFFQKIGLQASYRLPHRVKDGYGLKKYFIDEMKELDVNLVVTVDCGTKDLEIITHAKTLGIDVVVTDHHSVPDDLSQDAVAVINPNRPDCDYNYKYLAGAGVAFKVVQALAYKLLSKPEADEYIRQSIDIAAIGTVADCMSLTGENRIIVSLGLEQVKQSRSKGIREMIGDQLNSELDADLFGFTIGPRLNAAGRMDTPYKAVNVILNNGASLPKMLAEIEALNEKRKVETRRFVDDALTKIHPKDNLLFYVSPAIEHGIIGIVAGRLTEQFYKPSIVLKDEGDKLVASCRSPDYFSIIEILDQFKDDFIAYGGHKQAAGFSISKEKFPEFRGKILQKLNKIDFSKHKKEIIVDKVVGFDELGFGFLNQMQSYKPFGIGNTKPLFLVKNVDYKTLQFLGKTRDHLQFKIPYGFKIFAFFMGDFYETIKRNKQNVDIIFELQEDNWMGNRNLMLKVVDIILPQ